MKRLVLTSVIALAISATASANYDPAAAYNSGNAFQFGSWIYDGTNTYVWSYNEKTNTTSCEITDNYGCSYFLEFSEPYGIDNGISGKKTKEVKEAYTWVESEYFYDDTVYEYGYVELESWWD
ncbi:MAG: hypothetical protein MJ097_00580 [Dorea sp.]|nr:hypothetical protein [Dorea sp.]